jgi:hypothetical protein
MTTANSLILAASGVTTLGGAFVWRLGMEFERAWLRAEAAPEQQWELDLCARRRAEPELWCEAEEPDTAEAVREPVLA